MTIFRVRKDANYVVINRTSLNDQQLTWKAKGILAYMLSMPDDWKFYITELSNHSKDGLDSLKAGIKELKEAGYIQRYPVKENGKIIAWETHVFEFPQEEKPQVEIPPVEKPLVGNPPLLSIEEIITDLKPSIDGTKKDSKPTNQSLIAELVDLYRKQPNVKQANGDYPFIGKLYNSHGYDEVYEAIHKLGEKTILDPIENTLTYLRGILKRGKTNEPSKRNNESLYQGYDFGF